MPETMPGEMRTLLGTDPYSTHPGLQFPRLPPGLVHPLTSRFAVPPRRIRGDAALLTPRLEDFRQAYHGRAAGLLDSHNPGIVPPGHPLYSREASAAVLKSENDRLLKENRDLKRQLDGAAPDAS